MILTRNIQKIRKINKYSRNNKIMILYIVIVDAEYHINI